MELYFMLSVGTLNKHVRSPLQYLSNWSSNSYVTRHAATPINKQNNVWHSMITMSSQLPKNNVSSNLMQNPVPVNGD